MINKKRQRQNYAPFPLPVFTEENRDKIRKGLKTQTRRILRPQPLRHDPQPSLSGIDPWPYPPERDGRRARVGTVGQVHYLREPLVKCRVGKKDAKGAIKYERGYFAHYKDDGTPVLSRDGNRVRWRWKRRVLPAMHMPKKLARTYVKLLEKRGEWLGEITDADAVREGIPEEPKNRFRPRYRFVQLWDSINTKGKTPRNFASDPFVNVITFELLK